MLTGRHGFTVITCKGMATIALLKYIVWGFRGYCIAKVVRKLLETFGNMINELILMIQKHFDSFRDVDMA
jgi:hypothetical protein